MTMVEDYERAPSAVSAHRWRRDAAMVAVGAAVAAATTWAVMAATAPPTYTTPQPGQMHSCAEYPLEEECASPPR